MVNPQAVVALVDWNSQLINSDVRLLDDCVARARRALDLTIRRISRALEQQHSSLRFRVRLRLYHGWHQGFRPTENRRAIQFVVAEGDVSTFSPSARVLVSNQVQYGDELLLAIETRLNRRPAIHLPNTLRRQRDNEPPVEKMVDTALAADLLVCAREEPSDWALIVSDDDDFVPPIFVAEAWLRPHSGRVFLLSGRRLDRTFLRLEGLVVEIPYGQ